MATAATGVALSGASACSVPMENLLHLLVFVSSSSVIAFVCHNVLHCRNKSISRCLHVRSHLPLSRTPPSLPPSLVFPMMQEIVVPFVSFWELLLRHEWHIQSGLGQCQKRRQDCLHAASPWLARLKEMTHSQIQERYET